MSRTKSEQRADDQQPDYVAELLKNGTATLSAPSREALAEMVNNIPAETKYMVGAVGRSQDGSAYTLQVDLIKK